MRSKVGLLLLAVLLLAGVSGAYAQTTTGQIQGEVKDRAGQSLAGVTVTASSPSMLGERAVMTDKNGKFQFALVPAGSYTLQFSYPGFSTIRLSDVKVLLGGITTVPATMVEGQVETVTVTAALPLIQTETADNSTNLTSAMLDSIPTSARSFRELTRLVPSITSVELNTSTGTANGFPSIRGEGQYGDNYLIDGLTVRDPAVKTTATPLNYDAIEEVQIITDGFSPEYGQALGGSVNVITKSGSNNFGGELAWLYTSDSLTAGYQPTFLATPTATKDSTPYVNVGGPILKDKLWYFASYNREDSSDEYQETLIPGYGTLPVGVTDVTSDTAFGKLSWAPNSKNNLSLNYTWQQGETTGLEAESATPEARSGLDVENTRIRFNYQVFFSADSVLELKYGNVNRDLVNTPLSGLGPAQYELSSYGITTNNSWRASIDERKRDDYALIFSQFLNPGGAWGSHELKAGFEYHEPSQISTDNFSGRDEDVFSIGVNPDVDDFGLADTFSSGAQYTFAEEAVEDESGNLLGTVLMPSNLNEYRTGGALENSNKEWGFFLQDRYEIGRWNFLAGFRMDKQKGYNDAGELFTEFDWDRAFSPRLQVTWDATGDGRNVFKSGWGRFYDTNSTRFGEFANSRESYAFRNYGWAGAPAADFLSDGQTFQDNIDAGNEYDIHNPDNWGFVLEQSNASNPLDYSAVSKPNQVERFLVEYNRLVGKSYAFKTRWVSSKASGLIDDIHYQYNNWIVQNTDLKRRDYESIEFEFNGNPSPNFSFNASYVHSAAKGTNPGQFESSGFLGDSGSGNDIGVYLDRPQSNPAYWCDLYGPACVPASWVGKPKRDYNNDDQVNEFDRDLYIQGVYAGLGGIDGDDQWYGLLPYSIDDLVKLSGRVNIPKLGDTYVTAFFQWASGYHTGRRGFQPAYGDYLTFSSVNDLWEFVGACNDFSDCEAVETFLEVPGQPFQGGSGLARGVNTNAAFWSLDLAIGKVWTFAKNLNVELRGEFFNVFNTQTPLSVQDRAVSNYGEALTRQQPRSARIFARLAF